MQLVMTYTGRLAALNISVLLVFTSSLSATDTCVPAQDKALVFTDISIAIPHGCYGRIG